jgi:hypothetical protein
MAGVNHHFHFFPSISVCNLHSSSAKPYRPTFVPVIPYGTPKGVEIMDKKHSAWKQQQFLQKSESYYPTLSQEQINKIEHLIAEIIQAEQKNHQAEIQMLTDRIEVVLQQLLPRNNRQ